MRLLILSASMIACATGMAHAQSAGAGTPADLAGIYERRSDSLGGGTVKVETEGSGLRLTVQLGGAPNGDATAGDCGFIAEGELKGGVFDGKVTRTEVLEGISPEGEEAPANTGPVKVEFADGQLTLTQAPTGQLCAGGVEAGGRFLRAKAP